VRRHPSEKIFGVQLCGSRPQALVPAAEQIVKHCDIDFLGESELLFDSPQRACSWFALYTTDINCGCPIDLVFNKGAGSALLQHATKLGKSLVGMSQVLGEIPLTIKIRNGVRSPSFSLSLGLLTSPLAPRRSNTTRPWLISSSPSFRKSGVSAR
jgi:tRNA-dihydrouridine synthase 3